MSFIKAISYYLPEKILSNEDLVKEFPEWTVEKIANKVGVNYRHIIEKEETSTDLAIKASENLFEENKDINKENIDFVILCTQSPDYIMPASSCIIQERLGLSKNTGAFDFNLGCSGYIYGLGIAKGLIAGKIAKNILFLTAESISKFIHPRDKGNRTIFGDAATATLISSQGWGEIKEFVLGTNGEGFDNLIVKTGASRNPNKKGDLKFDDNGNPISSDYLYMNGSEIFSFTQKNVPLIIKDCINKNKLTFEDIDFFIFHQANSYMLEFLRKKMKIPKEKFIVYMSEIGNTVSNSIPIALYNSIKSNIIPKGKGKPSFNVLLCGFGVGYSWGACIIKIKN